MAGGSVRAPSRSTASGRSGSCLDRPSLLVVDGLRASFSRKSGELRGFRRATGRARTGGDGLSTVVMFLLVPQVQLRKRLDVARAAERWSGQLPTLIEQQLRSE